MLADKPFVLFASCIPVKGAERAVLCDMQRHTIHFIPEGLYEILTRYEGMSVWQVKAAYQNEFDAVIDSYFRFLEKEEFIFFTDNPGWFPKMDLRWEEPKAITNALIDIGELALPWEKIIDELEYLGCGHLQIRSFSVKPLSFFENLIPKFQDKRLESIVLSVGFHPGFDKASLLAFYESFPRISAIQVHTVPAGHPLFLWKQRPGVFFFSEEAITSSAHCGIVSPDYFTVNLKTFTEALRHNSCLNRKIAIDVEGNIKNCPSLAESFGNIKDTTLPEAMEKPGFRKYWDIDKSKISVCKDCEFRYVCTDCRAYLENPGDIFSKPLKCGYNPYTCDWEEWSDSPLKKKAMAAYGLEALEKQGKG